MSDTDDAPRDKARELDHINDTLRHLRDVRDTGVQTTRHGEVSTTFRPIEEIQHAIVVNEAERRRAMGRRTRRITYITSIKGL